MRRRLFIGHGAVEVREDESVDRTRLWGEYVEDPKMIRVSVGMSRADFLHVLFHEMVHMVKAMDGFTIDKEVEEQLACCISNRMVEALVRNKWLRDEIADL